LWYLPFTHLFPGKKENNMMRKMLFWCLLIFSTANAQDSLLTARQAVDIAVNENLNIQIVRGDLDIAAINNNWGNAGRWPTVTAGLANTLALTNLNQQLSNGTEINRNGATNDILNVNLTANWRVYNGMRVRASKARFEELEKMGEIAVLQQITQIGFDVLVTYYNLVRVQQQVKAISAIIDLSRERLHIAETRFSVGSGAKTDMLQAAIDLNAQLVALQNLYLQVKNNKAILNTLMKRDPATPVFPTDTTFEIQLVSLVEYKQKIDSQNYQMLLAQRERNLLAQDRKIINSQRLPVVSLNSVTSFNRNKASAGLFLVNQTYGPNIGIGVGIPIYNSNIFKTQLRVNEVQQKQQQQVVDLLRTEIQRDMQIAYQEYQNSMALADLEAANVKLAQENEFISSERFKKLQGNSIELRQAQLSLIEAQDRFINARFRAKLAATTLQFLAGELEINQ
jgi:outer membrane protein TolC